MWVRFWFVCFASSLAAQAAAQPVAWNFEDGPQGWKARAGTVKIEHLAGRGATAASRGYLHIQGSMNENWNYALSGSMPLQAGHLYRLSAWVKVVSTGSGTPMPFLKCEFVAAEHGRDMGRASTNSYDAAGLGQWQHLTAEFQAPAGTVSGWIALEKGTSEPTQIDAYLDDITVEPIEGLTVLAQYDLDPTPADLEKVRGVHPRLYLTAERVSQLREAIRTTHAGLWADVKVHADRAVERGAPSYRQNDGSSNDEQLWQREVGNTMPYLAMAYLLTEDRRYLDAAKEWALASCDYPTWGYGRFDGRDLATGHQLFGLAIVYDWCYHDLDDASRRHIRETLAKRASAMFQAAATGNTYWHRSYLQNHLWVNVCGVGTAGLALFDEVDEARLWIGLAVDKFQRTMAALGPDGASHEGVGYWEYGAEYMLKFMDLADHLLDVDFYDCLWWRNTSRYCQYLSLPIGAWTRSNCIVDVADCPRSHWYGPDHILRHLAQRYRDGHAQWLAEQVDQADVDAPGARWLNLIWYDPSVRPIGPQDIPTLHHFEDMGIVSARTGWGGDENLIVFKCGPFIGHKAIEEFSYDPGGGHVHPDTGHFVIFGDGQWLVRDDGYGDKWTDQHNTLLVDGTGQLGEGHTWFNGSECLLAKTQPRILNVNSSAKLDHIVGDVTAAYPKRLGLERFVRHLLFVKPDVLIVIDDIAVDKSRNLELRLHTEGDGCTPDNGAYLVTGRRAVLRVDLLTPDNVTVDTENVAVRGSHARGKKLSTMRLTTRGTRWRNALALSWSPTGQEAKRVSLKSRKQTWTFTVADRKLIFDWVEKQAVLQP